MTKQEKIKEAWGVLYDKYKHRICSDGFLHYKSEKVRKEVGDLLGEIETSENLYSAFRPISLSGIENNSGWIKIESDSDLPKDEGQYWVHNEKMKQTVYSQFDFELKFRFGLGHTFPATHYQPIEKPKPPIY